MDYSQNGAQNAIYGNQLVSQTGGGTQNLQAAPTPRTITSAASRIDALNERLGKVVEGLSMVSSQLGALTPVAAGEKNTQPAASGAVHRLNDSADTAHARVCEIENLIGGITRALG
jgi:hypothetical protein